MSDYIYMLESHLNPEQNRVVEEVQKAAEHAGINLFLTGGAMRDMLAGFQIRDLDFVVEGAALKVAKFICEHSDAKLVSQDENRKSAELIFPGGVTAQVAMARQEKYGRSGSKPQVSPATIQEDLRGRDFTCNAIALSLNKASRGLLLDPMNGLADIERKELRAISTYGFYDDPSRLLRLVHFAVRLGFTIEERTRMQVANAREAEVEKLIPPRAFSDELRRMSAEENPAEILKGLAEAGLLALISPALGEKGNPAGITKFEKICRMLPDDVRHRVSRVGPFLYVLCEKLNAKEKQALIKSTEMPKADQDAWHKLEARSQKLESALKSARIHKASQVYHIVAPANVDEVIFLLYHSSHKQVQDRLRNYYQKYLITVQEITAEEWATVPGSPGTPKYNKAREEFVTHRLDRRVKKPPAPVEAPPPPPPPSSWSSPQTALARRGR